MNWKAKREAIAVLFRAGTTPKNIADQLGVGIATIYRLKKRLDCGSGVHPPRKNYPGQTVLTPQVVASIKKRIRAAPNKSMTKVAVEQGVSRKSVYRVVKMTGGRSLRRKKVPLISAAGLQRRLVRCRALLNNLKSAPPGRIIFFPTKKTLLSSLLSMRKMTDSYDLDQKETMKNSSSSNRSKSSSNRSKSSSSTKQKAVVGCHSDRNSLLVQRSLLHSCFWGSSPQQEKFLRRYGFLRDSD